MLAVEEKKKKNRKQTAFIYKTLNNSIKTVCVSDSCWRKTPVPFTVSAALTFFLVSENITHTFYLLVKWSTL